MGECLDQGGCLCGAGGHPRGEAMGTTPCLWDTLRRNVHPLGHLQGAAYPLRGSYGRRMQGMLYLSGPHPRGDSYGEGEGEGSVLPP